MSQSRLKRRVRQLMKFTGETHQQALQRLIDAESGPSFIPEATNTAQQFVESALLFRLLSGTRHEWPERGRAELPTFVQAVRPSDDDLYVDVPIGDTAAFYTALSGGESQDQRFADTIIIRRSGRGSVVTTDGLTEAAIKLPCSWRRLSAQFRPSVSARMMSNETIRLDGDDGVSLPSMHRAVLSGLLRRMGLFRGAEEFGWLCAYHDWLRRGVGSEPPRLPVNLAAELTADGFGLPSAEQRTLNLSSSPTRAFDHELHRVVKWFQQEDPDGSRMLAAIREAANRVLDGPRTGRYRYEQLDKQERAFLGHQVDIEIGLAFKLLEGSSSDFIVAGAELDVVYSERRGGWLTSRNQHDKIALLIYSTENLGVYGAGICRLEPAVLKGGGNQDGKQHLAPQALDEEVVWLADQADLPTSIFLRLPPDVVRMIFALPTGSQRTTELIRQSSGQILDLNDIATVAGTANAAKRVRGARQQLATEGIHILSAFDQERMAGLNLPPLARGQYAIVRGDTNSSDWVRGPITLRPDSWVGRS